MDGGSRTGTRHPRGAWQDVEQVSVDGVVGWVYNKYLGTTTWMAGSGPQIVANKEATPIYCDDYANGGHKLFTTVSKGTIIADTYFDGGDYYELHTGHDYLLIKKTDVTVKN